jgi:hypothetical protein
MGCASSTASTTDWEVGALLTALLVVVVPSYQDRGRAASDPSRIPGGSRSAGASKAFASGAVNTSTSARDQIRDPDATGGNGTCWDGCDVDDGVSATNGDGETYPTAWDRVRLEHDRDGLRCRETTLAGSIPGGRRRAPQVGRSRTRTVCVLGRQLIETIANEPFGAMRVRVVGGVIGRHVPGHLMSVS